MYLSIFLYALASLVNYATADCVSYGIDFIDGGSYFIDNTENTNFTFLSDFVGCDSQNITPILVAPDESSYFCSDIPTTPDNTPFLSTCPILQTAITSGQWIIVIEGSNFAFVRTFQIDAGVPVYTTVTEPATVGITSTPDPTTVVTTSISTGSTVLLPSTTITACKSLTLTKYTMPKPVTSYTTMTLPIIINTGIVVKTGTTTSTATAACTPNPFPRKQDPLLQRILQLPHITISPSNIQKRANPASTGHPGWWEKRAAQNMALERRGPDAATSTITTTAAYGRTVTSTTIAPTPTVTRTSIETTIITSTPPAVTSCKGVQMVTTTSTFPTFTYTRLQLTLPVIFTAKTISLVKTTKTTWTDAAASTACINSGGRM